MGDERAGREAAKQRSNISTKFWMDFWAIVLLRR
jgi:hypothetical protein